MTKKAFRKLVKLWLKMGCRANYIDISQMNEDDYIDIMMKTYTPEKFIEDIEIKVDLIKRVLGA